ncbi:hypothetical protein P3T36_005726 [Kitasatospora sp. MAP12-15]|nr:hypothetical protein [Kitasatospora sp. MAP12-44]
MPPRPPCAHVSPDGVDAARKQLTEAGLSMYAALTGLDLENDVCMYSSTCLSISNHLSSCRCSTSHRLA